MGYNTTDYANSILTGSHSAPDQRTAAQDWARTQRKWDKSLAGNEDLNSLWMDYEKYARAGAAGEGLGLNTQSTAEARRRTEAILARIEALGGDTTGREEFDYSSGTFDLASTQKAGQVLRQLNIARTGKRPLAGAAKTNENIKALWEERNVQEAKNYEKEQITPFVNNTEQAIADLMDQMTITAERAAAMRSKVIETTRSAEASRLARVAAVSGRDPNDPSIQAMALRTAQETDEFLTNALKDMEFQIADFNAKGGAQKVSINSQFAAQKLAIHQAAIAGDMNAMRDVTQGISALMQAAEESAWQRAMYQKMLDDSDGGGGSMWGTVGTVVGGAAGAIIGGPAGAQIGAQLGGAVGGAVDGAKGNQSTAMPSSFYSTLSQTGPKGYWQGNTW